MTLDRDFVIDHRAWTQGNPKVREPRKADIGAQELELDRAGSDRVLAGTPFEEDPMADQQVLDALAKIADEVSGLAVDVRALYTAGFKGQSAGKDSTAHEQVSIRGVNAELDKVVAALTETNRLLGEVVKQGAPTPEVPA